MRLVPQYFSDLMEYPGSLRDPRQATLVIFLRAYPPRIFEFPVRWLWQFAFWSVAFGAMGIGGALFSWSVYRNRNLAPISVAPRPDQPLPASPQATPERPIESVKESAKGQLLPAPSAAVLSEQLHQGHSSFALITPEPWSAGLPPALFIQRPVCQWQENTLLVQFALQVRPGVGGHQHGRIFVFARGPDSLHAYPARALSGSTGPTLIAPEQGEGFSVSRYRAVQAEFHVPAPETLSEAEILIIDRQDHPMLYSRLKIPPRPHKTSQMTTPLTSAP